MAEDTSENATERFFKAATPGLSPTARNTLITSITLQARIMENKLLLFCVAKCPMNSFVFDSYSAIIGQSSTVVGIGEEIEIVAGVGAFSRKANPVITIDGTPVLIADDGVAYFRFKGETIPGKYSRTAVIRFKDIAGREQVIEKEVKYTVVRK